MKNKKIKSVPFFALFITLLIICGCKQNNQNNEKLNVEVLFPLTGDVALYGNIYKNSLMMSIDTSKINIYFHDTEGDPKKAVSILRQVSSQKKIDALVSFVPAVCEALNPICESKKILHFGLTFTPQFVNNKYALRQHQSSIEEANTFVNYIKGLNLDKIVFLRHMSPDAEYGYKNVLEPQLTALNKNIIDIPYDFNTKDFKDVTLKVKQNDPDLIVVQTFPYNYRNIISNLNKLDLDKYILADLNYCDVLNRNIDNGDLGIYNNIPFVSNDFIKNEDYYCYLRDYETSYKSQASLFGAFAYDLGIIINNLKISGLPKDSIISYYNKEDVKGVVGPIKYDSNGNIILRYEIVKFENNEVK